MKVFNLIRFLMNPIKFQKSLLKKYGDPFPMALPGQPVFWLTQDPEKVKTIFTAPINSFSTSPHNPVSPLLGENGLIMQSGKTHQKNRKAIRPFFSQKNLQDFPSIIEEIYLKISSGYTENQKLCLQDFAQDITLKVIIKFLFPRASSSDTEKLILAVNKFFRSYKPFFLFVPKGLPGTWKPFLRNKSNLDNLLYKCFQHELSFGDVQLHTELSLADKDEVLDQLRTLIIAGHETTAVSLTWSLYYASKNKDVCKSIRAESKTTDYIVDYIKEVLRICPPVPFIMRKLLLPLSFSETLNFNTGEELGVSISLLHQNEKYWKSAETLKPQRFQKSLVSNFAYAPYGGGNRKCLGETLANMELTLITKLFIKDFYFELTQPKAAKVEVLQITFGPRKPLFVKLKKIINM